MSDKRQTKLDRIVEAFENTFQATWNIRVLLQWRFDFAEGQQNFVIDRQQRQWQLRRHKQEFKITENRLEEFITSAIALLMNPHREFLCLPKNPTQYDATRRADIGTAFAKYFFQNAMLDGTVEKLAYYTVVAGVSYAKVNLRYNSRAQFTQWEGSFRKERTMPWVDPCIQAVLPQRVVVNPQHESLERADEFWHVEPHSIKEAAVILGKSENWIREKVDKVGDERELTDDTERLSGKHANRIWGDPNTLFEIENEEASFLDEERLFIKEHWERMNEGVWVRSTYISMKNSTPTDHSKNARTRLVDVTDFPFCPWVTIRWTNRNTGIYPTSPISRSMFRQMAYNWILNHYWQRLDKAPPPFIQVPMMGNFDNQGKFYEIMTTATNSKINVVDAFSINPDLWRMLAMVDENIDANLGMQDPSMGGMPDKVQPATTIIKAAQGEQLKMTVAKNNFVNGLNEAVRKGLMMAKLVWPPERAFAVEGSDDVAVYEWFEGEVDDLKVVVNSYAEQETPPSVRYAMTQTMLQNGMFGDPGTYEARRSAQEFGGADIFKFIRPGERVAAESARQIISLIRQLGAGKLRIPIDAVGEIIRPQLGQNSEIFISEISAFMNTQEFIHMSPQTKNILFATLVGHQGILEEQKRAAIEAQKPQGVIDNGTGQGQQPSSGYRGEPVDAAGTPIVEIAGGEAGGYPSGPGQGVGGSPV